MRSRTINQKIEKEGKRMKIFKTVAAISAILLMVVLLASCGEPKKVTELEKRIADLEAQNAELQKHAG